MNVNLSPCFLSGKVEAPASKSFAHRILIGAYLSGEKIKINGIGNSEDVLVTLSALKTFGAKVIKGGNYVIIERGCLPTEKVEIDCKESGSSLRFLLPVASALGIKATFTGCGRLLQRPITPLTDCLNKGGAEINGLTVNGRLQSGIYKVDGGISSQYITGLIFALSVIGGEIAIKGELVSKPYVDITLSVLKDMGVKIQKTQNGYKIQAGYNPTQKEINVEGDWSGASFLLSAGAINGEVSVSGLNLNSTQGDRNIVEILKNFGAIVIEDNNKITVKKAPLKAIELDCQNIPDLVKIIAVVGAYANGKTIIKNVSRLKIKESDRIQAVINTLKSAKIKAEYVGEDLIIYGGTPVGATFDGGKDHRTVMSSTILALGAEGCSEILGAEYHKKSYPSFFEDVKKLGGILRVDI